MDLVKFDLEQYLIESGLEKYIKNADIWKIEESSKKLQYFTHGFFRFFGKFPPPIASRFIDEYLENKKELVLDPMVGSGTTLVEATLKNVNAIGADANGLCTLVSKVKTTYVKPNDIRKYLAEWVLFSKKKSQGFKQYIPKDKYLEHWFFTENIKQLATIREFIEKNPTKKDTSDLFKIALSSIIRNVSRASKGMGRMFLDPGLSPVNVYELYAKKISVYLDVMENWDSSIKKQKIINSDARNLNIDNESIGLTICHPPYYNLYRYSSIFKFEMLWLGLDYCDTKKREIFEGFKMGNAERVDRYISDMILIMNEIERVLKKNRYCVLMIGDAVIKNKRVNTTSLLLKNLKKFKIEKIIVRIPKYTEASYAASQRRTTGDIGVNIPDHLIVLKKP